MIKGLMQRLHGPIYQRRLEVLTDLVAGQLRAGDSVLDVGCGNGQLGQAILSHPKCPENVAMSGLEKFPRGGEPIPVTKFDGDEAPFADDTFDVVILADVLHHERQPANLLRECSRIAKRLVLVKDHKPAGLLGQQRISFLDWAANHPYGVECLYTYFPRQRWHEFFKEAGLKILSELDSIKLYPQPFNTLFGNQLQYWSVLEPCPTNP